jgi:hypothetical protein
MSKIKNDNILKTKWPHTDDDETIKFTITYKPLKSDIDRRNEWS